MPTIMDRDIPWPGHLKDVPATWWISMDMCQHVSYSKLSAEPEIHLKDVCPKWRAVRECVCGMITSPNNLKQSRVSTGKNSF